MRAVVCSVSSRGCCKTKEESALTTSMRGDREGPDTPRLSFPVVWVIFSKQPNVQVLPTDLDRIEVSNLSAQLSF